MKDDYGSSLSGLLNVLFLELPKVKNLLGTPSENLSKIEKWALFLSYADKSEAQPYLTELFKEEEGLMNAKKSLCEISEDERNWWIQNSIDTARRDRNTALHNAERRGEKKGLVKGMRDAKLESAKRALALGLSIEQIAAITGLTEEEIKNL